MIHEDYQNPKLHDAQPCNGWKLFSAEPTLSRTPCREEQKTETDEVTQKGQRHRVGLIDHKSSRHDRGPYLNACGSRGRYGLKIV